MAWNIRFDPSLVPNPNQSRIPLAVAIALAGLAPNVSQVANRAPVAGSISFSGVAPTVSSPRTITPNVGGLSYTFQPASVVNSGGAISITTASIADATQGNAYTPTQLVASGGSGGNRWERSGELNPFGGTSPGVLPVPAATLSYDGKLGGLPMPNAEANTVTYRVTDSAGVTATRSLTWTANAQSVAFNLLYSSNIYGSFQLADVRYKAFLNWWGNGPDSGKDPYITGYSHRSWKHYAPVTGGIGGYPLVGRGWYKNASFFATTGGGTAPLQSAGIQISALTKAKMFWVMDTPIDRTNTLAWAICDNYFHSISNPNGSGDQHTSGDANNPIFNWVILPYFNDTSGNFEFNFNHTGSSTNPDYGATIELDGRMWMYWLFDSNAFAQYPSATNYNNSCYMTPLAGLNDCKQGGFKYFYIDYKKATTDFIAASAAGKLRKWNGSSLVTAYIPVTTSSYMSNMVAGWEIHTGGNSSPDNRIYYTKDLQISLQSEADPVIHLAPEVSDVFSQNLPVYTPNGTVYAAPLAVSGNYQEWWRSNALPSTGTPLYVAQDISSVDPALLTNVMVTFWTGDANDQFYTPNAQQSQPADFIVECTTAQFSAGVMPATGWTQVGSSVTGNVVAARALMCGDWAAAGYKSWRWKITNNSSNSTQNSSAGKMMASFAPTTTGAPDGIFFFGDSITKKSASNGYGEQGGASDNVANGIYGCTGKRPVCINAGISGWSLGSNNPADGSTFMPWLDGTNGTWLDDCPYRTLWLATGKNDSLLKGRTQSQYQTDNAWAVNRWLSTRTNGFVVIPAILNLVGDTANPTDATKFSGYNANLVAPTVTALSFGSTTTVTINYVSTAHPFAAGQVIDFSSTVGGTTQIRGLRGTISSPGGSSGAWTFVVNINSSGFTTFTSGGTVSRPNVIQGPDLNNISDAFKSIMFDVSDTIHPGVFGQPIYKSMYLIDWFVRVYYFGMAQSHWLPDFSVGTGVGGR